MRINSKLITLLLLLGIPLVAPADDFYPRNHGIDILHYRFQIRLSENSDRIQVQSDLRIRLLDPGQHRFSLDFKDTGMTVETVTLGEKELPYNRRDNKLWIEIPGYPETGVLNISVGVSGIPGEGLIIRPNKNGDRTFLADHWPNKASGWLPCNDHPSDKATCEFLVTAPADLQVVATGIRRETRDLPGRYRLIHYEETAPVATKIIMMAASRYAVDYTRTPCGIPVEAWVYTGDRETGFTSFTPVTDVLEFYSGLIGPYSFSKIASVQGPTDYGGLENAGAVTYNEDLIGHPRILDLIAHEMAHQWFGDAVTEVSWDHVWLSEGFATYFTTIFWEMTAGAAHLPERMKKARDRVIRLYQKYPARSVVDPDLTDIKQILSANTYQKGAWVLHMLRFRLGDDRFFKGIRQYYRAYRDQNVSTADFQSVMERVSGGKLDGFFQQWVYGSGLPELSGDWKFQRGKKRVKIRIVQDQASGRVFRFPLEAALFYSGIEKPEIIQLAIRKRSTVFCRPVPDAPVRIVLDPRVRLLMISKFGD